MNRIIIFLVFCAISIRLNAQISDVFEQENTKLKRISKSWAGSNIWHITTEYEYDSLGRISKVSTPKYDEYTEKGEIIGLFNYRIYFYNSENQLETINHYGSFRDYLHWFSENEATFQELSENEVTCKYSYDKYRNKLKEVCRYISATDSFCYVVNGRLTRYYQKDRADSTLYFYDENNRIKREEKYLSVHGHSGGEPQTIFEYKYEYDNQGKLVTETCYSGGSRIFKHIYQNGLKVKTETYWGNNEIRNETKYFYDEKDNLIYLESREISRLSSFAPFDLKFEYY